MIKNVAVFLIAMAWVSSISAQDLNPRLKDLQDNTWIYLGPKPSRRYFPVFKDPQATEALREADRVETREPQGRVFTNVVYGDGRIFYFGGGSNSYPGNDVEMYDIVNNIWIQSYKPNVAPASDPTYSSGGSPNFYLNPATGEVRPYQLHGYARTSYHQGIKRYICTAAFCEATAYNSNSKQWECSKRTADRVCLIGFDPVTRKWELLADPSQLPSNGQISEYDEALGGVLLMNVSNWNGIWLFKDKNTAITKMAYNGPRLDVSGGATMIYIPDLKSHFFALLPSANSYVPRFIICQPAEGKWLEVTSSVPSTIKDLIGTGGNWVMAYDRINKKVVVLQVESSRIRPWIYDVIKDMAQPSPSNWQQLPISPASPNLGTYAFSVSCRAPFVYDSTHNAFILVLAKNTHQQGQPALVETWGYRYKKPPGSTRVGEQKEQMPLRYELFQNSPNPFNPITTIRYSLPIRSRVVLRIYDMQGELVTTLVDEIQNAGLFEREWGGGMTSGVYFCKLEAQEMESHQTQYSEVRKMLLVQ